MKKWLMLAFLPLLLLVQQEVGASPIYESSNTITTSGGVYSYLVQFYNFTANSFDYLFNFEPSSNVDLHSIPPLTSGGTGGTCTPPCQTKDGSLIKARITDSIGTGLLSIVDLLVDGSGNVTGNRTTPAGLTRNVNVPIGSSLGNAGGTIAGTYTCPTGDSNCSNITNNFTCIQTKSMLDAGTGCGEHLAPIKEVTVPVVNSFLLLGIGLMALAISLHRGQAGLISRRSCQAVHSSVNLI